MAKKRQRKVKAKRKAKRPSSHQFMLTRPGDLPIDVSPKGPHTDQSGSRPINPAVRLGHSQKD
jgi:hypothetical protein